MRNRHLGRAGARVRYRLEATGNPGRGLPSQNRGSALGPTKVFGKYDVRMRLQKKFELPVGLVFLPGFAQFPNVPKPRLRVFAK